MERGRKFILKNLRFVDVVMEICDARAPRASSNPLLKEAINEFGLSKILVLNKQDLADRGATRLWLKELAPDSIIQPVTVSGIGSGAYRTIFNSLDLFRKKQKKKKLLVLICGIPNSGKSTIINSICKRKRTKVGATPGLTREVEKIFVSDNLEVLDSPGLLWPRFDSHVEALKLSAIGAIKETVLPSMEVLYGIFSYLRQCYPCLLGKYFKVESNWTDFNQYIFSLAKARGCCRSGGEIDYNRMCQALLKTLREGHMGWLSMEWPDGRGWKEFREL